LAGWSFSFVGFTLARFFPVVLAAVVGGGRDVWVKSKQSLMSSEAASRAFKGFKPKVTSQNFTKLT
jgi:hypothetical protein